MATEFAWGDEKTQYFFQLTPEQVLDAVEQIPGIQCTGRCQALGSFENRVYQVEIEEPKEADFLGEAAYDPYQLIVKFYRPGRWSQEQILEEHEFLQELWEHEIPAVPPFSFPHGSSLAQTSQTGIYYSVFPRFRGRSIEEWSETEIAILGRFIARMHNVGSVKPFKHRLQVTPETYGLKSLAYLQNQKWIPLELEDRYQKAVENIAEWSEPWFNETTYQRIHGDCHLNNILWNNHQPVFVDFDDTLMGPPVQDIWLLTPGRDGLTLSVREQLLQAYEQMREFDRDSLKLVEPLRALRMVHFSAWIAKRWEDPAFQKAFSAFGTQRYWEDEVQMLEQIARLLQS